MGKIRKYTDQDLINTVANSVSIAQVLVKLNIIPAGGNYATMKRNIARLGLDTTHFTGKAVE